MINDSWQQLQQITTISQADIPLFFSILFMYTIYRFIMTKLILPFLAKQLEIKQPYKFINRAFDMTHYISSSLLGLTAILQRPYGHCFFYSMNCRDYYWQTPDGFQVTVLEKIYYLLFLTYYIVDFFFLGSTTQPNMFRMHHILTANEIIVCIILKAPVTGLTIMVLHDVSDWPLYTGKVLLYCGLKYIKDFVFLLFPLGWAYFRLFNFPIVVYNVIQVGIDTEIHPYLYKFEEVFLVILYVMHCIWAYQIGTNIYEIIIGKPIHDNRSDDSE